MLGGEVLREGEPPIIALANSWIPINAGGPPTDDKPTVTLEPPRDPDRISSFLNIRIAQLDASPFPLPADAAPAGIVVS